MKIVIEDKELISECKATLKELLTNSTYFHTIASECDMESIIDSVIDIQWFFTGKISSPSDFNYLVSKIKRVLPRKSDGNLYDIYESWGDTEYRFIISEAILAINSAKSKKYDSNGHDVGEQDNGIDILIQK